MDQTPASTPPRTRVWPILLTVAHSLAVVVTLLFAWLASMVGMLSNFLFVFLLLLLGATVASRIIGLFRKSLEIQWLRHPIAPESRVYLWQWLNRSLFFILSAVALSLAFVPFQFKPQVFLGIRIIIWSSVVLLIALALVPHRKVRVSTNTFFSVGWVFLAAQLFRILSPATSADAVTLRPPFHGEWYIFQGGRSALVNHHYAIQAQRNALDILLPPPFAMEHGVHHTLPEYPAFGQTLYAPADGKVIAVVNDRPDMAIGKSDTAHIVGNHIVLEIAAHRFVLLAHLKQGSVKVSPGDVVTAGQPLAECGNSGNTSEPHLHLQVQDYADFETPGLRTFPILFQNVTRTRGGEVERLAAADVRRNDRIAEVTHP